MAFGRIAFSSTSAWVMVIMVFQVGCISRKMTLDAQALYHGYDARYVVPMKKGQGVQFDPRLFLSATEKKAWIVTDPILVAPSDSVLIKPGDLRYVDICMEADVPDSTSVTLEVRSADNAWSAKSWTSWKRLAGMEEKLLNPNRFIQVRATLTASSSAVLPVLHRLVLTPKFHHGTSWNGSVTILDHHLQKPIRSPLVFHYGRPDHPDLVWLRKVAGLDGVIAGKKTDFQKLLALNDWAGALPWKPKSPRIRGEDGHYVWDIRKTIERGDDGLLTLHGHCMSYSQAFVAACVSMGYVSARHCAVLGFREASHEVAEVWVPDMKKWVYMDPTMTQYYYDKDTKRPLNLLEMHDIVSATFVPEDKDMRWFSERKNKESRAVVRRIGGKTPIRARTGDYQFGTRTGGEYDWGWFHGYLTAGFIQITPRNDFQQHPEAVPNGFSHYPGYACYPNWVDVKTPPRSGGENWFTRKRDYYWTLDQATLVISKGRESQLSVMFGNTMPFFARYEILLQKNKHKETRIIRCGEPARLIWTLGEGVNDLSVTPIDEFGKRGLASSIRVRYR